PDVDRITTGFSVALAIPTAKNEPERSSICTNTLIFGWRWSAMAIGAEREPGDTHAYSTPCCASSSTNVAAKDCATSIGLSRGSDHPAARLHPHGRELGRARAQDAIRAALDHARPARPRHRADRAVHDG